MADTKIYIDTNVTVPFDLVFKEELVDGGKGGSDFYLKLTADIDKRHLGRVQISPTEFERVHNELVKKVTPEVQKIITKVFSGV